MEQYTWGTNLCTILLHIPYQCPMSYILCDRKMWVCGIYNCAHAVNQCAEVYACWIEQSRLSTPRRDFDGKSSSFLQHSLQARYVRWGIPMIGELKQATRVLTHILLHTIKIPLRVMSLSIYSIKIKSYQRWSTLGDLHFQLGAYSGGSVLWHTTLDTLCDRVMFGSFKTFAPGSFSLFRSCRLMPWVLLRCYAASR